MSLLKRWVSVAVASAALMAVGQAQAVTWNFSYSGAGVTASGTFTTAGPATTFEDILSISGTRNGQAILGLVPVGEDTDFSYDNQFRAVGDHFTDGGMLLNFGPTFDHLNVYFDGGYIEVNPDNIQTPITFNVTAVPEAATLAYMGLGLAGVALAARRTRRREEETAPA